MGKSGGTEGAASNATDPVDRGEAPQVVFWGCLLASAAIQPAPTSTAGTVERFVRLCDEHGARLQGLDCPCGHAADKWAVFDRRRGVVVAYGSPERISIVRGELGIAVELFEQADKNTPVNRKLGVVPAWKKRQLAHNVRGAIAVHSLRIDMRRL